MTAGRSIFDRLDNSPAPIAPAHSWPSSNFQRPRTKRSRAMAETYAALEAQALITARAEIEDRAAAYARDPRQLDAICDGLSSLAPARLVETLEAAIRSMDPVRNFGFGGCIPAINLHGALMYAKRLQAAQEKFP